MLSAGKISLNETFLSAGESSETLTKIPLLAISRPWWAMPLTNVIAGDISDSGSSLVMPMVSGYTDTTLSERPMAFATPDIFPKKTSKLRGPSLPATLMYLAPRTTII